MGRVRGGGVLIALLNKYSCTTVDTAMLRAVVPLIDVVISKFVLPNFVFYVVVLYIPPDVSSGDMEQFFDALGALIAGERILLVGDFNIPNFNTENSSCRKVAAINDLCQFLNLQQINCVLNQQGRLLDLVFTNLPDLCVEREDLPLVQEDRYHPALCMRLRLSMESRAVTFDQGNCLGYNFKRANFIQLYNQLCHVNWSSLDACRDVDGAVDRFYSLLYGVLDESVPRRRRPVGRYPTWFTTEIMRNIKSKEYYRRRFDRTGLECYGREFRRLRSLTKTQIDEAYRVHLRTVEEELRMDPGSIFRFSNERKGVSRIPGIIKSDRGEHDNPQSIVAAFAELFLGVYRPRSLGSQACGWTTESCVPSFSIGTVTESDVINAMAKLPNKFTAGDDHIPSFFVRDVRFVLAKPMASIINMAIRSATFPRRWKVARVVPVLKKGDPANVNNYRPISILSNLSKVMEHIMYVNIYHRVKSFLSPNQHGFMSRRSTVTNLASISQFLAETLDNGGQADVIYTDFSKAFDVLDHCVLLRRITDVGFSPSLVRLMASYLENRTNCVLPGPHFQSVFFYIRSSSGFQFGPTTI